MPSAERSGTNSPPAVGFVGLGRMGAPMARCLARADFGLRLYDSDPAIAPQLASETGGVAAASLAELAADADVVILMLPNSRIVRQVCLGDHSGGSTAADSLGAALRPGAVVIDMSSSDPIATRQLGADLEGRGIVLFDAPVSGGVRKAVDGSLAIMLGGGDEASRAAVIPVVEAMGKVFHTGGLGSGHAIKALNNYVSAAGLAAACEAVIVARAFGIDPAVMTDVINASTGRNNSTENKIKPFVLSGEFGKAGFALDLMAKDVGIAAELSRRLDLSLPGVEEARRLWGEATAALGAGADHTEIFRHLWNRSGGAEAT